MVPQVRRHRALRARCGRGGERRQLRDGGEDLVLTPNAAVGAAHSCCRRFGSLLPGFGRPKGIRTTFFGNSPDFDEGSKIPVRIFRMSRTLPSRAVAMLLPLMLLFAPPSSRSEEHTSELQSLMRISYAVF